MRRFRHRRRRRWRFISIFSLSVFEWKMVLQNLELIQYAVHNSISSLSGSYSYPYHVVSTVMAVAGSGLAVACLPYRFSNKPFSSRVTEQIKFSPAFPNWINAFDHLNPFGFKRGARFCFRQKVRFV